MNIFETTAETIGYNFKGVSKIGVKIHPAAGDHEINQLQRQSRSMMRHIIIASFPCIWLISCHRFNEMFRS
jgi:hypothetical protein